MTETPLVIVNMMRAGPSTGQATLVGQGDLYQSRYGTHGADHELIVLAPATVAECYTLTVEAFNLSERFRCPLIILGDEHVAHLTETVELPETPTIVERKRPERTDEPAFGFAVDPEDDDLVPPMPKLGEGAQLLVTGSTHDHTGLRDTASGYVHRKLVRRLADKITAHGEELTRVELTKPEEARLGIVSFGSVSRAVERALLEMKRPDIAHLRLVGVWPFPDLVVRDFLSDLEHVLVPELNAGQLVREIERIAVSTNVHSYSKVGGGEPITPEEIRNILGGLG
jgi:2-oxoglutarate ferredoxin oxidoreductase subunit alpha